MENNLDIVIVGCGPSGLFSALKLIESNPSLKIAIFEKGREVDKRTCPVSEYNGKCLNCSTCNMMCGIGGAGLLSDGILNLKTDAVGGNLYDYTKNDVESQKIVDYIDNVFLKFGAIIELHGIDTEKTNELYRKAISFGIKYVQIKQRHLGSENTPKIIQKFAEYLRSKNVEIFTNTEVTDLIIENNECKGIVLKDENIFAKKVIFAPGRVGANFVNEIVNKYQINAEFAPIDIGVRVEVPASIMSPIIDINRDPKFHIWSDKFEDFIRTFCVNHEGFVVKEKYDDVIGTNGHSYSDKKSKNTNFAFVVKTRLTEPLQNTMLYGKAIATLATTLGNGKPIIQRFGDLKRGRRSNEWRLQKSTFHPTLEDVTPGNISMALPHRIITDIIDGLEKLNELIPGVAMDSTFLYCPEIKYYSRKITVNDKMETNIKNLYVAGDGAGLSRDIVKASATGILVADALLKTYE